MIEKEYYEIDGDSYVEEILGNAVQTTRLRSILPIVPRNLHTLLDVGCGSGAFLKFLTEERPNMNAIGLERSHNLALAAQKILKSSVIEGSIDNLPFNDNSFQVVTAMEVIEHIPHTSYKKSLTELERVAEEMIIISVPYKEVREFISCPACSCCFSLSYHMREFSDISFSNLFESFELSKLELINVKLPIMRNLGIRLANYFNLHDFNKYCICPACGYRKNTPAPAQLEFVDRPLKIQGLVGNLKSKIKPLYPKANQPIWAVAVYVRKSNQSNPEQRAK
jgi:SAM-dependent methyltransferase